MNLRWQHHFSSKKSLIHIHWRHAIMASKVCLYQCWLDIHKYSDINPHNDQVNHFQISISIALFNYQMPSYYVIHMGLNWNRYIAIRIEKILDMYFIYGLRFRKNVKPITHITLMFFHGDSFHDLWFELHDHYSLILFQTLQPKCFAISCWLFNSNFDSNKFNLFVFCFNSLSAFTNKSCDASFVNMNKQLVMFWCKNLNLIKYNKVINYNKKSSYENSRGMCTHTLSCLVIGIAPWESGRTLSWTII